MEWIEKCKLCLVAVLMMVLALVSHERGKVKTLKRELYEDKVTGGYTYAKFEKEATKALEKETRKAAFIAMDIDQFRLMNEFFGVESGDVALCRLNGILREWIKPGEVYCRKVADNFSIMAFYDTLDELRERVEKLVDTVMKVEDVGRKGYVMRPFLGIYLIEDRDEAMDVMQNNASIAHSMIKEQGTNYYGIFDVKARDKALQDKIMEGQIERAYRNKEFTVYYQPKFDAKTQKLNGAEALIRWVKPNGSIVSPTVFIPLAEKKGMVVRLDKCVFELVCEHINQWKSKGLDLVPVSVNLSREHLKDETFIDDYVRIREKYQIEDEYLELELTEGTLYDNLEQARPIVEKLHNKGVKILMDDFGTGYSSLMMLKSIPVDVMKLDKSFVDDYDDARGEEIIKCVVALAGTLKMDVTAEGVETKEQYEFLRDLGCDTIQGYYFSKPLPAEEFEKLLEGQTV